MCRFSIDVNVAKVSFFIQDIDIIASYSDTSGAVRISRVKMRDLSASWVLENPIDRNHDQPKSWEVFDHYCAQKRIQC